MPVKEARPERRQMEPVRVCFVIDSLSRAGTEMQLLLLLRHFDRGRIEPHLCLLDGESPESRALEPANVPVIRLGMKRLRSWALLGKANVLRRYLRKNRIEIVQSFFLNSTYFSTPVAKAAGVRGVFASRRNVGHWMNWKHAFASALYNRLFIDKIVANCEAARQAAIQQERARPNQVCVINNGIELSRFESVAPWQPRPRGLPTRIGMLGNLREVKGPDVFLEAAKIVIEQHPDTRFEIAGSGETRKYQGRIAELEMSQQARLIGSVNDIPGFLSTLDVAVLPSRAEGLSNAILEYMAAGRPIVATDVGGTSELIANGRNGILVPAESPRAIAEAIIQLIACPNDGTRMAADASQQAHARFGAETAAENFANLYCGELGVAKPKMAAEHGS